MTDLISTNLRPIKPKGSEPYICFEIIFKGEHVMGEAGPYWQFFSDISSELIGSSNFNGNGYGEKYQFNYFIPTPNN